MLRNIGERMGVFSPSTTTTTETKSKTTTTGTGSGTGLEKNSLSKSDSLPPRNAGDLAKFALKEGESGLKDGGNIMNGSMGQLAEAMKLQMENQTQMALMQVVKDMNNAQAKTLKGTGTAVKDLAG